MMSKWMWDFWDDYSELFRAQDEEIEFCIEGPPRIYGQHARI